MQAPAWRTCDIALNHHNQPRGGYRYEMLVSPHKTTS